jgi:hypothetical protein
MYALSLLTPCYREWCSLCVAAMHALVHLHPCPDQVVTLVLQQMYASLSAATASAQGGQSSVCATARLLFALGQTSLCSLVYTEFVAAVAKKHPVKDSGAEETKKAAGAAAAKAGKKSAKADSTSTTGKQERGVVSSLCACRDALRLYLCRLQRGGGRSGRDGGGDGRRGRR